MCQGLTTLLLGQRGAIHKVQGKGWGWQGRKEYLPPEVQRSNSLPTSIDFFKKYFINAMTSLVSGQVGHLPHIRTLPLSPALQPCSPWAATPTDSPASSRSASRAHLTTAAPRRAVRMATAGVAPPRTTTATRSTASARRLVGVAPLPAL